MIEGKYLLSSLLSPQKEISLSAQKSIQIERMLKNPYVKHIRPITRVNNHNNNDNKILSGELFEN